ncbi:MAG: glycosyltransferase family 4 protein [Pseudomonadota bacterium]
MVVNFFFINGGTEKYLYDLMGQLRLMGHTPIPFSVRYSGIWDSSYNQYFLPPPGHPDHVHYKNIELTATNWVRFLDRSIYSIEARYYLSRLLKEEEDIQIGYLLNIYNYMSPSIIHSLKKNSIPVVMQIGDYHLLCPNYSFLRDGKPCTLCIHGAYYHGFRYLCVKGSVRASALRVASMYIQKWLDIYKLVDAFVVPCLFMKTKLVEGGFPEERIHLMHYPVTQSIGADGGGNKKNYIIYVGRISYEKGLDTLIEAYQELSPPVDLVFIGRSQNGEMERLKGIIRPEHGSRIQFVGFKTGPELYRWIAEALFSVVPSRWYDNAPISIYESFVHGTPVLASNIGGIPEQIQDGVNGRLFIPDSKEDLKDAMEWMLSDRKRLEIMGRAGQDYALKNLSIEEHTGKLMGLFESLLTGKTIENGSKGEKD